MRTLYEGNVSVAASDYTHSQFDQDSEESTEAPIEGLDDRVCALSRLTFTLDYPFDRPYHGEIITDAGPSLRQIIDAIRQAYRTIYRGASQQDIPNLENKLVDGDYGRAFHVIDDLVIESIHLDEETAQLDIGIGS
ncbi:MAG: hypothetical protein KBG28_01125 [Kofleriaceae bacterium]|nr:hypothetical protein [Kofleriaceae bacterium]MBP9202553.1 hypothetical protein [Kofleriaceae bacterium]